MCTLLTLSSCATYQPAPLDVRTLSAPTAIGPLPADPQALLQLALDHDPAVAAARANLTATEARRRAARNLPPLSLTLTAEYSKDADPAKPWLWGGALGVPLDVGNRRAGRVTAADLDVVRARYALGEAIWSARQRLAQAQSDLASADEQIILHQTLLDQRTAYRDLMQKRVAAGEDAHGLYAQAALDVSSARQALALAQSHRAQATAALARALDADPAAITTLPRIAPLLVPIDATPLIDAAVYNRADILSAVADYDMAENDLRLAIAAQYPEINIQPGYTWERGDVKIPVSLALTLPPLDGNRAAIDAAQAARLAAGKTLEDKVKWAHTAAAQAATIYAADLVTVETLTDTDLPAAGNLAARTEAAMRAGESDRAEALAAAIAATQATITAAEARQTARNDRLALEDALRQPLDPAETALLTRAATP
ncbi:MAG: TolC family protein [Asticcacaulis sp.]|nr:TolC family protein [Asticcacaulis sp.]